MDRVLLLQNDLCLIAALTVETNHLTGHTGSALYKECHPFFIDLDVSPWYVVNSVSNMAVTDCFLVFTPLSGHFLPFIIPFNAIRMEELLATVETIHQHASPRTGYNLLKSQRL